MMRKREILMLSASGVGLLCLAASFVLPLAIYFAGPFPVGASMWENRPFLSVALVLGFVVVAAVPIIRRTPHSWLFPLCGSIPVIAFGQ